MEGPNTIGTRERAWQKRRVGVFCGEESPIVPQLFCPEDESSISEFRLNFRRRIAPECGAASRTASDDPIFQPAKFSAENPLREIFTAQIHIVSNAAKQTIDA